jgi:hypothetical protein
MYAGVVMTSFSASKRSNAAWLASPGDYRWSSFDHYATGVRGAVEIESEWTASVRGPLIAIKLR